jgi:uncharacterized protein (TIGR02600 family)
MADHPAVELISAPARPATHRCDGVALVLVLSILVLLTAVVVAFLVDSLTDLSGSKSYSEAIRAQSLAGAAVNVVEGQIRAGVAGVSVSNQPLAWASQPGMIRTYDTGGNLAAAYKLYSSNVLQLPNAANSEPLTNLSLQAAVAAEIPAGWNLQPADFVDINSPELISDPNGTIADPNPSSTAKYIARFPIIDGNNLKVMGRLGTNSSGTPRLGYDVNGTNPGSDFPDIAGFSIDQQSTYNAGAPLAANNNPAPLPVRWIYVLQNGEMQARDSTGKISGASSSNPVVGRIAFWTDDDTCKLNVNTASEGTFWDRPWVKTPTEEVFSTNFPAQNEFQMFPGHPAKTCLSTVLGANWLWPVDALVQVPSPSPAAGALGKSPNYYKWRPYYDLTPRVTEGSFYGSAGATQVAPSTSGIPYDTDRLYASLDDIMFKPLAAGTATNPPSRQARNVATTDTDGGAVPPISPQFLETTRFFLTTSNRSPEVTLFNTPRISLWPIQQNSAYRTVKDQLLAFCSTVPAVPPGSSGTGYPYYFQRLSATKNLPGTTTQDSSGLSCESPTADMTIARNSVLYSYIKQMLSSAVPGLGGNFSLKYPATMNQIITEMLDQIRSGVNTCMSNSTDPNAYSYTQPQGDPGMAQVVPLQISDSGTTNRGFGRFSTIVEAAIDFFRVTDPATTGMTHADIGAFLILQPFNPTPGFPSWSPDMRIEVDGLSTFAIAGVESNGKAGPQVGLGLPGSGTNIVDANSQTVEGTSSTEFNGLASMFYYNNAGVPKAKTVGNGTTDVYYPFANSGTGAGITVVAPVTTSTGTVPSHFSFYGGTINIKIYSNPTAPSSGPVLLQTLTLTFPNSLNLPTPTYNPGSSVSSNGALLTTVPAIIGNRIGNKVPGTVPGRSADGGLNDGQYTNPITNNVTAGSALVDSMDVVRSIIVNPNGPSKGDYRVIAALGTVPENYFTPHPFYTASFPTGAPAASAFDPANENYAYNWLFAHSLRSGVMPGYGTIGWYNFTQSGVGAGNWLDKDATQVNGSPSGVGRKGGWRGGLVANPTLLATHVPTYYRDDTPAVPPTLTAATLGASTSSTTPGDWDTGYGNLEDGPYVNKPDEANGQSVNSTSRAVSEYDTTAYFNRGFFQTDTGQSYSPNRQIASAVAFGSLPTGINQAGSSINPWQTLLFCPIPAAGSSHPGYGTSANSASPTTQADGYPAPPYSTIPDYDVLDLFTMPIVEPYAISEPLSTQGKVNMNYQIAPFTYIRRDTGVQAVMKSTWFCAIPSTAATYQTADSYKEEEGAYATQIRYSIYPDETAGTLKVFEDRFNSGDIFHSASEICGVPLVPQQIANIDQNVTSPLSYPSSINLPADATYKNMSAWWSNFNLTGDNLREAPYGDLYPRLTTKSNTFTVHVRVQALKKSLNTSPSTFVDPNSTSSDPTLSNPNSPRDWITAEYRGSFQIERYVDPNVSTTGNNPFPDYATAGISATPIDNFYKFRTIATKQF